MLRLGLFARTGSSAKAHRTLSTSQRSFTTDHKTYFHQEALAASRATKERLKRHRMENLDNLSRNHANTVNFLKEKVAALPVHTSNIFLVEELIHRLDGLIALVRQCRMLDKDYEFALNRNEEAGKYHEQMLKEAGDAPKLR